MSDIEHIAAAGGVVYRKQDNHIEVLVIFRRGVWDLPKGKLEDDESISQCAQREVAEEVGLDELPTIITDLPDTYHEYQQGGTSFGKTTHWFAMQLQEPVEVFTPQVEEDIQKVRWMPLKEAFEHVGYENLVEVLEAFAGKNIPL